MKHFLRTAFTSLLLGFFIAQGVSFAAINNNGTAPNPLLEEDIVVDSPTGVIVPESDNDDSDVIDEPDGVIVPESDDVIIDGPDGVLGPEVLEDNEGGPQSGTPDPSTGIITPNISTDPNFYTVQDAVVAPDSYEEYTDLSCGRQFHEYFVYNTSQDTNRYQFYAAVRAYAIVFDDDANYTPATAGTPEVNDFLSNVNTEELNCADGGYVYDSQSGQYLSTYNNCGFNTESLNTVVHENSGWGGTQVTYQEMNFLEGSPRGLLWEHGVDTGDINDMPILGSGEWWFSGAVSMLPMSLTEYQTATTTAYALMEYQMYDNVTGTITKVYPASVDADGDGVPDNPNWDPDGDHAFWYGTVDANRSIWEPCEVPCLDLSITPNQDTISVYDHIRDTNPLDNLESTIEFSATVINAEGDDVTSDPNTIVHWVTFPYRENQPNFSETLSSPWPNMGGEWMNTLSHMFGEGDEVMTLRNAGAGDWVLAKVWQTRDDGITVFPTPEGVCEAAVQLPYCIDITITQPEDEIVEGPYSDYVNVTTTASTFEEQTITPGIPSSRVPQAEIWPHELVWSSTVAGTTFDGEVGPYTSHSWSVDVNAPGEGRVEVQALEDPAGLCSAWFDIETDDDGGPPEDPCCDDGPPIRPEDELPELGEFDKFIYTFNFSPEQDADELHDTFFSHDADRAFYTLEYTPTGTEDTIEFTDDLWDGLIRSDKGGYLQFVKDAWQLTAGVLDDPTDEDQYGVYRYDLIERMGFDEREFRENAESIGDDVQNNFEPIIAYLTFDDNRDSIRIEECEYEEGSLSSDGICLESLSSLNNSTQAYVALANLEAFADEYEDEIEAEDVHIRIRYVAVVQSVLNCADQSDPCLTEKFLNTAQVDLGQGVTGDAQALLASLCQYIVTRNAGDVFLEETLQGGTDIACIYDGSEFENGNDYRNVDALVIYGEAAGHSQDTTGTYYNGFAALSASFCDNHDGNGGSVVSNLSSYVCEIVTGVADLWTSTNIETTNSSQVSQAIRNVQTTQQGRSMAGSNLSWGDLTTNLTNSNNPDSGVLYYQGNGETITLGNLQIPSGAWTLIVTNANVNINGNITYSEATDYTDLPSFAIIVEGGDINISTAASVVHAFMVTDQKFTGNSRSAVNGTLKIYGSLYGNVQELFNASKYVGAPSTDGGGLVIYYDERIILNTPPYLSEKVDIYTKEAVN